MSQPVPVGWLSLLFCGHHNKGRACQRREEHKLLGATGWGQRPSTLRKGCRVVHAGKCHLVCTAGDVGSFGSTHLQHKPSQATHEPVVTQTHSENLSGTDEM